MQEHDLVAEAARLAEVVRAHHDLRAGGVDRLDDPLHLRRSRPGRGSRWVRRGTAPRAAAPTRARARAAAARRRKARARTVREVREPDALERRARLLLALGAGQPRRAPSAYSTFASAERRSITGRWKTIAWRRRSPGRSGCAHSMRPDGGREQAVAEPHEHALPGAVRPEDDRPRPGLELERDAVDDRPSAGNERDTRRAAAAGWRSARASVRHP